MAKRIVIKELNKKKDELLDVINKLEKAIEQKQEEVYHIQSTITIFENNQNEASESSQNDIEEKNHESNIIKHDFKKRAQTQERNAINENLKNAINTQEEKVKKLHHDEKEILKQFKQLMRG